MPSQTLLMLSPVAVPDPTADPLALPRKFLDGMKAFAERWQGLTTLLLPQTPQRDDTLDYVSIQRRALPFEIRTYPHDPAALHTEIRSAGVVVAPMVSRYVNVPSQCAALGIPVVVDADLTPTVRDEIIRAENKNPLLRWRRLHWQRGMEKKYTAMVLSAQGIHLHGPAAYDVYAPLNPSPLFHMNTRVRRAMLARAEQMEERAKRLRSGAPLRLVFSGRWRPMKGVLDLPRVAADLHRLGVQAEWDIFGGGAQRDELARAIAAADLPNMRLRGEIPFPDLVRFAGDECDLFVCCHRQGDPSSTFIEMLSVGVPLIGYDTSGLRGVVTLSGAGWLAPREDVPALAARIAELDRNREALVNASKAAAEFTHDKSFEDVMQRRVSHLYAIATGTAEMPGEKVAHF